MYHVEKNFFLCQQKKINFKQTCSQSEEVSHNSPEEIKTFALTVSPFPIQLSFFQFTSADRSTVFLSFIKVAAHGCKLLSSASTMTRQKLLSCRLCERYRITVRFHRSHLKRLTVSPSEETFLIAGSQRAHAQLTQHASVSTLKCQAQDVCRLI